MSNYRLLQNGVLGSSTACPTCYDTLVLYRIPLNAPVAQFMICCLEPADSAGYMTTETVYVAQGSTFATASMIYSDKALTTQAADGFYAPALTAGSRGINRVKAGTSFFSSNTCQTCP